MRRRRQATGQKNKNKPNTSRRVMPDGSVVYVDKAGRRIPGGSGSGPTQRGGMSLAGAARKEAARKAGTAPAPAASKKKKAPSGKGVSKGSLTSLITKMTKTGMKHAQAAKKKAAANKRRGIKYIK